MTRELVGVVALVLGLGGCASRQVMKQQAVVIAASAEQLDAELSQFDAALDTVHRLRRVRIEGDRLAADRAARETEIHIGGWSLDVDPAAAARLDTFEGVRDATEAAGEHGYGIVDYKLGVEHTVPGYSLDRPALRRLVSLLLNLAQPTRFKTEVAFFVEYGIAIGDEAQEGIDEVTKMVGEYSSDGPSPAAGEPETRSEQ